MRFVDATIERLQEIEPRNRVRAAMVAFIVSIPAWPITSATIFAGEQQGILGLSWVAFQATLLNIVITTDVREAEDTET